MCVSLTDFLLILGRCLALTTGVDALLLLVLLAMAAAAKGDGRAVPTWSVALRWQVAVDDQSNQPVRWWCCCSADCVVSLLQRGVVLCGGGAALQCDQRSATISRPLDAKSNRTIRRSHHRHMAASRTLTLPLPHPHDNTRMARRGRALRSGGSTTVDHPPLHSQTNASRPPAPRASALRPAGHRALRTSRPHIATPTSMLHLYSCIHRLGEHLPRPPLGWRLDRPAAELG